MIFSSKTVFLGAKTAQNDEIVVNSTMAQLNFYIANIKSRRGKI